MLSLRWGILMVESKEAGRRMRVCRSWSVGGKRGWCSGFLSLRYCEKHCDNLKLWRLYFIFQITFCHWRRPGQELKARTWKLLLFHTVLPSNKEFIYNQRSITRNEECCLLASLGLASFLLQCRTRYLGNDTTSAPTSTNNQDHCHRHVHRSNLSKQVLKDASRLRKV